MKKLLAILLCMAMLCTASFALAEPLTGEADGFGGPIQAEVTLDGDKIVALKLTGDKETPRAGRRCAGKADRGHPGQWYAGRRGRCDRRYLDQQGRLCRHQKGHGR